MDNHTHDSAQQGITPSAPSQLMLINDLTSTTVFNKHKAVTCRRLTHRLRTLPPGRGANLSQLLRREEPLIGHSGHEVASTTGHECLADLLTLTHTIEVTL